MGTEQQTAICSAMVTKHAWGGPYAATDGALQWYEGCPWTLQTLGYAYLQNHTIISGNNQESVRRGQGLNQQEGPNHLLHLGAATLPMRNVVHCVG